MDKIKSYLLPVLILSLIVGLAIGFRSFLMANIIEPVAVLFWLIWRTIASVDQSIYWTILIILCSILVIRLIPTEKENAQNPKYEYKYKSINRVEHWQTLIKNASLGKDETENLRGNLKRLLESAIGQEEKYDPTDLEKIVAREKATLSTRAQQFLAPLKGRGHLSFINNLLGLSPEWLRKWMGKFVRQDTTSINEILDWMENEMEINHGK